MAKIRRDDTDAFRDVLGAFEEWVIALYAAAEGKGRVHTPLYEVRENLIDAVRVVVERSMDEE